MSLTPEALLAAGLQAQKAGDWPTARHAFEQVLLAAPEHPDACQLLGLVARRQGDDEAAEYWYRRSLASREAQPHVWNNLGNLLLANRRIPQALQAYDRALQLQQGFVDALYNRARALFAASRLAEASDSLLAAMASGAEPSAAMWQLKAQIEGAAGQVSSALHTLERALSRSPDHAALWHNRAVMLQQAHRHAEALAAHERAMALGLDVADAHYNYGNTLQCLGRMTEAEVAYRAALQRQPGHGLALGDLARLRWRQGAPDFDRELRLAVAAMPGDPTAAGILGNLLWRAERFEAAAEVFRESIRRAPDSAVLQDGLGRCLVRIGKSVSGLAAHRRAVRLAPDDPEIGSNHATSLLVCGHAREALAAAEMACRSAPFHQRALALLSLAQRLLAGTNTSHIQASTPHVRVVALSPPPGWTDMNDFNRALAEALRHMHAADRQSPIDQSLRGGTQTLGDIFSQRHPLVDALQVRITEAVTAMVAEMPSADADGAFDVFLARRPTASASWRFSSAWSSRLVQGGFHVDHVHPHGWISSAYYVHVPDVVRDSVRRQGWLRFGVPDFPLPGIEPEELVQAVVQPVPGSLVLFPSMLWHGTTPFDEPAERITIAFDVLPI
jgi:Flp pilus assembly protein TadD